MAKLEHEMEISRLSQCIADVPLQKRLSILENLYHQSDNTYSVHELCEALNVARGTFYNHRLFLSKLFSCDLRGFKYKDMF